MKVVIPNVSCGCIIGKGGATIRSFTEDSGADIKLSSRDRMLPGDGSRAHRHRPIDTVLRAVALVATALMDDDSYASHAARPSTYATHVNLPVGGIARSSFDDGTRKKGNGGGAGRVSITVAVPDEHIGAVLGKGGRTISEIQVVSGVRIKVSDRGDFVEGTRNRKVTLTGTMEGDADGAVSPRAETQHQRSARRRVKGALGSLAIAAPPIAAHELAFDRRALAIRRRDKKPRAYPIPAERRRSGRPPPRASPNRRTVITTMPRVVKLSCIVSSLVGSTRRASSRNPARRPARAPPPPFV